MLTAGTIKMKGKNKAKRIQIVVNGNPSGSKAIKGLKVVLNKAPNPHPIPSDPAPAKKVRIVKRSTSA